MISILHWKEPNELKLFDRGVLCITEKNNILSFTALHTERDWKWLCRKYHIKYWCFLSEAEPQNKEGSELRYSV